MFPTSAPTVLKSILAILLLLNTLIPCACSSKDSSNTPRDATSHKHAPGDHGGYIVPVGKDHYHAEVIYTDDGQLRLFMRGQDEAKVIEVPLQNLTAYARGPGQRQFTTFALTSTPQPGDRDGQTSAFEGPIPPALRNQSLMVSIPHLQIAGERYAFSFMVSEDTTHAAMPTKVTDDAERTLYLVPQGKYTQSDIDANGQQTASAKYKGFKSQHDMHPAVGQAICPITRTKANSNCTWIVNGQKYRFCCPPCIDEFVKQAKTTPDRIAPAESYVQQ